MWSSTADRMLFKLCNHPGCRRFAEEGSRYCSEHRIEPQKKEFKGGWLTDSQKAFYNSTRWRNLKAELLSENPVCQMCGMNPAEECHHSFPAGYDFHNPADFFDESRIICLCRDCHQKVTRQRMIEMKQRSKRNKKENGHRLWY